MGPFDRFNDRAKRVLALAQDEAIRFNHNYIGPEHILLGLVREGEGVAARALEQYVGLSTVRRAVEQLVSRGEHVHPTDISLNPATKKLIDFAIEEARKLGHSHVGTEHLLLAFLRQAGEAESIAAKVVAALSIDLPKVDAEILAILGDPTRQRGPHAEGAAASGRLGPFDRFDSSAKRILALAQDESVRFNHNYIGTEHLLTGILREGEGPGAKALIELDVELSKVRTALEFIIGRGDEKTAPNDITMSPRTKKLIELAIDEARRLGDGYVGSGHLLLGLVREGQGIASGILESLGLDLTKVRAKTLQLMTRPSRPRDARFAKYYDAQGNKRDWYCEDVLSGKLDLSVIHQDERVMAFHHPDPAAAIHVVIIPKTHVSGLLAPEALDPELLRSLMTAVQEVARLMGLRDRGFYIRSNAATKDVTPHMHWHVMGPGIPPITNHTP